MWCCSCYPCHCSFLPILVSSFQNSTTDRKLVLNIGLSLHVLCSCKRTAAVPLLVCRPSAYQAGRQPLGDACLDRPGTMWYTLCGQSSTCAIVTDSCPLVKRELSERRIPRLCLAFWHPGAVPGGEAARTARCSRASPAHSGGCAAPLRRAGRCGGQHASDCPGCRDWAG